MSGDDTRPGLLRTATYRLLTRIGTAMIPQGHAEPLTKHQAIARAIATISHPGGLRVWTFAGATLVHGLWLCVLEDLTAVHVVEIDARTGDAQIVTSVVRRRGEHDITVGRRPSRERTGRGTLTAYVRCRRGGRPAPRTARRRPRRHLSCRLIVP